MNIFHLKCFHDAALMGSVSEAARRNFISQPAVSKAIRNLEEILGVSLCHHKKQRFKLTPEGEIVFSKSKEIFSAIRALRDALDECQNHPKMPLHFVATQSLGLALLPDLIPRFKVTSPQVKLHFLLGGLSQIKSWLKQGIAEFALVIASDDVSEYSQIPLYTGRFGFYKHKEEQKPIDLAGAYVEHRKGFMVPEILQHLNSSAMPIIELNSWELIARTIESHGGYGLLPDIVVQKAPHITAAFSLSVPYTICAIFPKGEKLSFSAKKFLEAVSEMLVKDAGASD
jgi:DNA-binding transcriptional LysR family regulator